MLHKRYSTATLPWRKKTHDSKHQFRPYLTPWWPISTDSMIFSSKWDLPDSMEALLWLYLMLHKRYPLLQLCRPRLGDGNQSHSRSGCLRPLEADWRGKKDAPALPSHDKRKRVWTYCSIVVLLFDDDTNKRTLTTTAILYSKNVCAVFPLPFSLSLCLTCVFLCSSVYIKTNCSHQWSEGVMLFLLSVGNVPMMVLQ